MTEASRQIGQRQSAEQERSAAERQRLFQAGKQAAAFPLFLRAQVPVSEIGPTTFRNLQDKCETISPAVLNQRLKELQAARLVEKSESGYRATALGQRIYQDLVPLGTTARAWSKEMSNG